MGSKSTQTALAESVAIAKLLDIPIDAQANQHQADITDVLRQIDRKLDTLPEEIKSKSCQQSAIAPNSTLKDGDSRRSLEQKGWDRLEEINEKLRQDYTIRRQMLLTRVDCTVESFKWKASNDAKGELNEKIHAIYDPLRIKLKPEPNVSMAHLLAVREKDCDNMLNSVVSSNNIECSVRNTLIPAVPDRGGRPNEVRAPPKETFRFQQSHRGHSRGRGRGRGG